ncbi:MAG: alpha/beta hydrolase [Pyrinomonadaceae bacterium]
MLYFLLIPLIFYIALIPLAYFFAESLIFQPQAPSYSDKHSIIKLKTPNGEHIAARYFPDLNARYTILFSHGNAEDIGSAEFFLEELNEAGFAVLAYDYRGYGRSEGRASEKNSYQDIEAAYDYLTGELNVPAERIIIHGRSLGGAVSVDLAARRKCGGLIVESSFVSAFRVMTRHPVLPFDKFVNLEKIRRVSCPVLIVHGKNDSLIPVWHGDALFEAAPEPKTALWVEGAGHNDIFFNAKTAYLQAIRDFSAKLEKNER